MAGVWEDGVARLWMGLEPLVGSGPAWDSGVLWTWMIRVQFVIFTYFLLSGTLDREHWLRKKYVEFLDRVFQFAAYTLGGQQEDEDDEELIDDGSVVICPESPRAEPPSPTGDFRFQDPLPYLAAGMRAVVQDCVSQSFTSAELRTWNMLSRTRRKTSLRASSPLTIFYVVGFVVRWVLLMPSRVLLLVVSLSTLIVSCAIVGLLPNSAFKRRLNAKVVSWSFDFVATSISVVARFHNKENRPTHGIAVANHTSPIDSMVLATDQCYDMVGQKTPGILGLFMKGLSKSSYHIWFDRSVAKDRSLVGKLIQNHAQDPEKPPILIYPEGVCLNNTAVIQFRKGAFEIDSDIYPIAIRFDLRYGDPFWHQNTFGGYLFSMMTSWAIVCDVWYLPPTRRGPNESATTFASRVKAQIAHRGGFVQLAWDGLVRFSQPDNEKYQHKAAQWRLMQQREYARRLSSNEASDSSE